VKLDKKTGSNLLQWPVAEVESLRLKSDEFKNLKVKPGAVVSLDIETATQVCIHFAYKTFYKSALKHYIIADV
jgi:beta-fructofuranosidase